MIVITCCSIPRILLPLHVLIQNHGEDKFLRKRVTDCILFNIPRSQINHSTTNSQPWQAWILGSDVAPVIPSKYLNMHRLCRATVHIITGGICPNRISVRVRRVLTTQVVVDQVVEYKNSARSSKHWKIVYNQKIMTLMFELPVTQTFN